MKRYLVLAEGYSGDPHYGKTARGVMRYGADPVVVIVDSDRPGGNVDGVPVVGTIDEALAHEPTTALVGVAPAGGRLPEKWRELLRGVLAAGLDLESGMHQFLSDDPELAGLAQENSAEIRDLRRAPADLSVPTGENLEHPAAVVLTVGSDCAIGKMSVALELDRGARERGVSSVFVPTGQTGIAIAGWGIAVDAVVADFVAGAAERLVVEAAGRGGLLWVEGQELSSIPTTRESPSASTTGARRTSSSSAIKPATSTSRISQDTRFRLWASSWRCTSAWRFRRARPRSWPSRSTPGGSRKKARKQRSLAPKRRPGCPPTTLSVTGPAVCWTQSCPVSRRV